jgi:hypothetical protein
VLQRQNFQIWSKVLSISSCYVAEYWAEARPDELRSDWPENLQTQLTPAKAEAYCATALMSCHKYFDEHTGMLRRLKKNSYLPVLMR